MLDKLLWEALSDREYWEMGCSRPDLAVMAEFVKINDIAAGVWCENSCIICMLEFFASNSESMSSMVSQFRGVSHKPYGNLVGGGGGGFLPRVS